MNKTARYTLVLFFICVTTILANAYDYDNWPTIATDSLFSVNSNVAKTTVTYRNNGEVTRHMIYDNNGKPLIEIWETEDSCTPDTLLYSDEGKMIAYFSHNKHGLLYDRMPEFVTNHSIERDEIHVNISNTDDHGNWLEAHARHFARIHRIMDYTFNDPAIQKLIVKYMDRRLLYQSKTTAMKDERFLGIFPNDNAMWVVLSIVGGALAFIFLRRLNSYYSVAIASVASTAIMGIGLVPYYIRLSANHLLNGTFIIWSTIVSASVLCIFTFRLISSMSRDKRFSNSYIEIVGNLWCIFTAAVSFFPLFNIWMWTWLALFLSLLAYGIMLMSTLLPHISTRCPKCHTKGSVYVAEIIDDGKIITERSISFNTQDSGPYDIRHHLWHKTYKTTETKSETETTKVYQNLLYRYKCSECDYECEKRVKGDHLGTNSTTHSTKTTSKHIEFD